MAYRVPSPKRSGRPAGASQTNMCNWKWTPSAKHRTLFISFASYDMQMNGSRRIPAGEQACIPAGI